MAEQNSASAIDIISEYTNSSSSTGNLVLKASHNDEIYVADIYILKGKIYSCSIDKNDPPIGMRLYSSGLIPQEEFSGILQSSGEDQNSPQFFQALLSNNVINEKVLNSYVRDEFLSAMRIILTWTDIEDYEWRALEQTIAFRVPPLTLEQVYEKVASNYDILGGIMETIYAHAPGLVEEDDEEIDPETDAENLVPSQAIEPDKDDLSVERYNLWKKINGGQTLAHLIENYGQVLTPLLKTVYVLWEKGYINLHIYGVPVEPYSPTRREENAARKQAEKEAEVVHPQGIDLDNLTAPEINVSQEEAVTEVLPVTPETVTEEPSADDYAFEGNEEHDEFSSDEFTSDEFAHDEFAEHEFTDENTPDEGEAAEEAEKEGNEETYQPEAEEEVVEKHSEENPSDTYETDFVPDEFVADESDTVAVEEEGESSDEQPKAEEEDESYDEQPKAEEVDESYSEQPKAEEPEPVEYEDEGETEENEVSEAEETSETPSEPTFEITSTVEELTNASIMAISINDMPDKSEEFLNQANALEAELNGIDDDPFAAQMEALEAREQELKAEMDKLKAETAELGEKRASHLVQVETKKKDVETLRTNGERIARVYSKILASFD